MKPTIVRDLLNLKALEEELRKAGDTIIYRDETSFTAYHNGKPVKFVRVGNTA